MSRIDELRRQIEQKHVEELDEARRQIEQRHAEALEALNILVPYLEGKSPVSDVQNNGTVPQDLPMPQISSASLRGQVVELLSDGEWRSIGYFKEMTNRDAKAIRAALAHGRKTGHVEKREAGGQIQYRRKK